MSDIKAIVLAISLPATYGNETSAWRILRDGDAKSSEKRLSFHQPYMSKGEHLEDYYEYIVVYEKISPTGFIRVLTRTQLRDRECYWHGGKLHNSHLELPKYVTLNLYTQLLKRWRYEIEINDD